MQSTVVGDSIFKNLKLVSFHCLKNRKCILLFNADDPKKDTSSKNGFFCRSINIPYKDIRAKSLAHIPQRISTNV